nr:reverse transcriptase domain-containing protein [Tanacetum cinerariifolium]
MVTKLRNEITKFKQKPHESLFEACERYKLSIYWCLNHNMILVTQIDTFYDGLTLSHRDTIYAAAGGTFMQKTPEECYKLIANMTAHHNHWDTCAIRDETSRNISSTSTTKSPEPSMATLKRLLMLLRVTLTHGFQSTTCAKPIKSKPKPKPELQPEPKNNQGNYQNRGSNFNQGNNQNQVFKPNQGHGNYFNQAPTYQAPTHQPQVVPQVSEFQAYMKANDAVMENMQTQMTLLTNSNLELKNMFGQFMKLNTASSSSTGSLPSNTIPNPWEDLKVITTHSGVTLAEPSVSPSSSCKEVDREPETITDLVLTESTNNVPPLVVQPSPASTSFSNNSSSKMPRNLHFELSFTDALLHMSMFSLMFKSLLNNKEKLFYLATTPVNENCSTVILKKFPEKVGDPGKFLIPSDFPEFDECLALADLGASINLMPLSVWKNFSLPELTSTQMIL